MASLMHSVLKKINAKCCRRNTIGFFTQFHRNYASQNFEPEIEAELPPSNQPKEYAPEEIEQMRDICRVEERYRGFLRGAPILPETLNDEQSSLAYQRSLYGRYGSNSGVDPGICFTTKEELEDIVEYEKVANTEPILEIRKRLLADLEEEKRLTRIREVEFEKKLAEVEGYKTKIRAKLLQKLNEAEAARQKREKLLDEVKRHFGYTIDPNDEKFQLMLEQKEKEQKKLKKELKKKKQEEYFLASLAALESGESNKKNYGKTKTEDENEEGEEEEEK